MAELAYQVTDFAYQGAGEFAYQGSVDVGAPLGGPTPAGKRRHLYYIIYLKGERYVFASADALVAFLARQELAVERRAKERARVDAKRILRVGREAAAPKPPRVAIRAAQPEIRDYVAELQKQIDRHYWAALLAELGAAAETDEDIAVIASFL